MKAGRMCGYRGPRLFTELSSKGLPLCTLPPTSQSSLKLTSIHTFTPSPPSQPTLLQRCHRRPLSFQCSTQVVCPPLLLLPGCLCSLEEAR